MRGLSVPTAINLPAPAKGAGYSRDFAMDQALPRSTSPRRKKLLAEAGYPQRLSRVTIDYCPNDRYNQRREDLAWRCAACGRRSAVNVQRGGDPQGAEFVPKGAEVLDTSQPVQHALGLLRPRRRDLHARSPVLHSRDGKGPGESNGATTRSPSFDDPDRQLEGGDRPAGNPISLLGRHVGGRADHGAHLR
jgi:hypothetical protein